MNVIRTDIEGLAVIEPRIFKDPRGYFFESFSERDFAEQVAPVKFVQDNESKSSYGVIRGLHFQKPPYFFSIAPNLQVPMQAPHLMHFS